jgi:hypothetical protein
MNQPAEKHKKAADLWQQLLNKKLLIHDKFH